MAVYRTIIQGGSCMSNNTVGPHKSSFGMDANMAVLIAYLGGVVISFIPGLRYIAWAVPLVVFFMESQSNFIKFHAMQSLTLNLVGMILGLIVSWVIGGIIAATMFKSPGASLGVAGFLSALTSIISIIIAIFAIIAVSKGWKYEEYKIPFIGDFAMKLAVMFGMKA